MDFKQIQELINLVNESNLGEVTIEQKDFRLTIKQKEEHITQVMASSMPMQFPQQQQQLLPQNNPAPQVSSESKGAGSSSIPAAISDANLITIKSPMIGTFYSRPSPEEPDFVQVGDEVTTGTVVCIIEAMKLFNEIESEVSGKIVKILVEDSSPVEYDHPLFLLEPA